MLRAFGRAVPVSPWDDEAPIRQELFSIERLEQHAESLAAHQSITVQGTSGKSLSDRLKDTERVLLEAYRSISQAVGESRPITRSIRPPSQGSIGRRMSPVPILWMLRSAALSKH